MKNSADCSWEAILDLMPGPQRKPTLRVTGKCTFPTPGYTVTLVRHVPQGINPAILLLDKIVTPPTGVVPQVITTIDVTPYVEQTEQRFTDVTILPDNTTVPVKEVH
jgi:hypothetical protein